MTTPTHIVIVGGGTAGWLTAAFLARSLGRPGPQAARITVVESPDIPIIGVGEGSFPTLRSTLSDLGVSEAAFARAADATFKQGVRFTGWAGRPTPGHNADDYLHVFELPYGGDTGLLPAWLATAGPNRPAYADSVTAQERVMRADLAPKRPGDPDWSSPFAYAYHFDAPKMAAFLRQAAIANGVTRIEATIGEVRRAENGDIAAVVPTGGAAPIEGDLFVDCTGFAARLIGETMGSRFTPVDDILFNDRAIALQVPYDRPDAPIASYTHATAHEGGWIWDIGLSERRGTGCVYSSRHMTDDEAERVIRDYAGKSGDGLPVRQLRFRTGYRETQWIGNCVAIGLSAGFFEPLESTGIMLIEVAARMLAEFARNADRASLEAAARAYNKAMPARFAAIVEFLKLHYAISHRRDSAYWRDNTDPATWPDGLADKLAQWRRRLPSRFDFVVDHESFLPPNWQYILYGHGFETDAPSVDKAGLDAAYAAFAKVRQAAQAATAALPSHRALVAHYHRS